MKYLWIGLGWTSLSLGIVGAFLPLLPTTPFLLLAAFAFSRGSKHMHDWLISHPTFGPVITNWQENRSVSRNAKWLATLSIVAMFALSLLFDVPIWALASQGVVLCLVLSMLWTRPEPNATQMQPSEQPDHHTEK